MRGTGLILLLGAMSSAAQETPVKATRVEHVLVVNEVYLNGRGPFRMLIDTGAASCLIRPVLAEQLGLRAVYAVDHETLAGVRRTPAAVLEELRVGAVSDQSVEILFADVSLPGVDGSLGQSWLVRHDYLLDYRRRRLVLESPEPARGIKAALRSIDGRPAIAAEVDGRPQDLALDSGAPVLILFGQSPLPTRDMLLTNTGSAGAIMRTTRVRVGPAYSRRMQTAEVNASPAPGLLPTREFGSVYISNRNGVVVLVP